MFSVHFGVRLVSQYYFSVYICLNCYVDGVSSAYRNELLIQQRRAASCPAGYDDWSVRRLVELREKATPQGWRQRPASGINGIYCWQSPSEAAAIEINSVRPA